MSLPLKGIYKDTVLRKQPDGFSPDVRNMVVDKKTGVYCTEPGNEIYSEFAVENNLQIIGIKTVLNRGILFFSRNLTSGLDEIGILDNDKVYTPKIQADLGFSIDYPFHPNNIQVEYNFKNQLIVAFTDNLNTPKIVNLDNPPSPFNIDEIQLFPTFKNPIIDVEVLENSGSLKSGVYYGVFHYKNNDGTVTSKSHISNPIYIVPSTGTDFNTYDGSVAGQATSKSIRFNLSNVDVTYDKIVLSIIYKNEGVLTSIEVKEINTGEEVSITYDGSEDTVDITIDSILVPPAFYNRIAHFTQVQGTLYGADVSEDISISLQKYANLIKLKFKSELLDVLTLNQSYKIANQNFDKKAFAHREVYGFYLNAKLKKGGYITSVHIPGRPVMEIDGAIFGNENDLNSSLLPQDSSLTTDIAISATSKWYQTRDTTRNYDVPTKTGTLGFWENEDEVYPNTDDFNSSAIGGEDLRGKKVRHHRFPSMEKCREKFYSTTGTYGMSTLDALSVVIDEFPTIPSEILDKIEGFEILYSKRTTANSTVIGTDIILNGAYRQADNTVNIDSTNIQYTSGGNWKNSQLSGGSGIDEENIIPYKNFLRLHSFDLLFQKPSVRPTHLCNEFTLNTSNIRTYDILKKDKSVYAFVIDYAVVSPFRSTSALLNNDEKTFAITDFKYVPNNTFSGRNCNYRAEEFANARIVSGNNRLSFSNNTMEISEVVSPSNDGFTTLDTEQTYFTTIMVYKKNIYQSFFSQTLASTGCYFLVGDLPEQIYGGDVFISKYGFLTYAPKLLRDIPGSQRPYSGPIADKDGVKVVRGVLTESVNNIGFRYEELGDDTTKYYPKEPVSLNVGWFLDMSMLLNLNNIKYNKDYSSVNDLNPFVPNNPFSDVVSDHPFRIIRSILANEEEKVSSWRTFLANDYFELRKDKGYITNIQGVNDNLFINLETTILRTRGNEVLKTGEIEAFIGSGNIFDRQPIELQTDEQGKGGCQNKFSCLLTPVGYFFIDVEQKIPFLVTDKLTPITIGLFDYFRENLVTLKDNPFKNEGLTVTWDEEYGRIIFSQLDIKPLTFSYTAAKGTWTSEHDCLPNLFFNNRKHFFSLKGQTIHFHNANNVAKFYGTIYPSYIVNVFRVIQKENDPQATSVEILVTQINWKTDVLLEDKKLRDITIDKIFLWNSYQATNEITLIPFDNENSLEDNFGISNTRRKKDKWIFNKFRDLVIDNTIQFEENSSPVGDNIDLNKSFELRKRLIDDFLAVKFLFSNEIISTLQPKGYLTDIDITFQQVNR